MTSPSSLAIHIPQWNHLRLLREACATWNVRHPDTPASLGPECEWPLLVNVVHSFLRHQCTNYDVIVCPENREDLRGQIAAEVRKIHPWLVSHTDPRRYGKATAAKLTPLKYFDRLSQQSVELLTKRSALSQALHGARGDERKRLQIEFAHINQQFEDVQRPLRTVATEGPFKDTRLSVARRSVEVHQYWFIAPNLFPCHLKNLDFHCSECRQRVQQSKRAVDLGAGIRLVVTSCHCMTIAISRDYACVSSQQWAIALDFT